MTDLYVSEHAVQRYRARTGTARPASEIRDALARMLRAVAETGAVRYTTNGVTFCFKQRGASVAVTTAYTAATRPRMRKVPRSDVSRKEHRRRHRQMNKRAG